MIRELDLKMPVVDPVKCVARIASKAGLSEKTKRKALEILKKAEEGKISAGKDPMGLAMALYVACVMNGENKTQKDVAQELQESRRSPSETDTRVLSCISDYDLFGPLILLWFRLESLAQTPFSQTRGSRIYD